MDLYYYMTSAKWAEVILKERRLKLSRFHESNDPFELNLIDSRDPVRREVVRMVERYHNQNTGMICFGKTWGNPVMWAHYAEKHSGVCLGFAIDPLVLSKVNYTDTKIDVELGVHLPKGGLSAELLNKVLLTKATSWEYEQEWRVLSQLKTPDPNNGLYYTDWGQQVEVRSVILGHRCTWSTDKVVQLIEGQVTAPVRIWKVRPAFGRFSMVEQHELPSVTVKSPQLKKTRR
ncbi:MAG: DUF2971 domain-containing protein [Polaromonas sp.]|uniref:DUF2971 domain-containing protein n=1 Tax=Polaromonas sp. TaxID=1869339 RepID=UPI0017A828E1|nr:DUF2971 domain-containing protein [Polaromonas sp.]NMM11663.1 DUF2971 domain-containing protein [Polaromonas sp.]